MPVWGDRYRAAAMAGDGNANAEKSARAVIKSLVKYLEAIQ